MSNIVNKIGDKLNQKLDKDAQPGNKVEGQADGAANDRINQFANDAGVPQQDDGMLDKVADAKVNSDIPFGNK